MPQLAQNLIAQARTEGWKRLELGNCNLTDLQTQVPELFELEQLEELVLSNVWEEWNDSTQKWEEKKSSNKGRANKLSQLPQAMAQLKQLKVLVCGGGYSDNWAISDLSFLQTLPQLTHLNLSNNQITKLENLDKLPNLQQLDISYNKITQLENLDKLPNLKELYIYFNKITKLENLDKLPKLQQLGINSNQITKLENLDELPNLQKLGINSNQITKLENLDKLPNLQKLGINSNQITKLENLDKLPNLKELYIYFNKITKLENLDKLPNLQQLYIQVNQITKLENLDKLPNLQKLAISGNKITKLENLDKLPNLQELDISNNKITKLENLDKLPNLQELNIIYNQITQLENLDKLPNLRRLNIGGNQITKLENLDKLPNLQKLAISGNKITKLENLDKLPNLQELEIGSNQITQLENLDKLPNLQELNIIYNQITQLENLDKLPNLRQLSISSNQITKLENLDKLPNLQKLAISGNKITKLENLDKLPNLRQLGISSNQITKLENLDKLPNLQQLNIGGKITKLENLDKLPNLRQLSISSNQITKLENLDKLPNLQQLDIINNQITKLENLDKLPNLQELDISSNQITKLENLDKLPNLQQLDISNNKISDLSPLLPFLQQKEKSLQLVLGEFRGPRKGEIKVADTWITKPPIEIIKKGTAAVLRYFETTRVKNKVVKMVLLGNSTVGKTSLLGCLIRGVFPETDSTHGIIVEDWLLKDTNLLVRVWDFGGQEYYHATHRLYLSRNAVYLVLWATETNQKGKVAVELSLTDNKGNSKQVTCLLDMEHYAYWLDTVRYYGGKESPLLLVQNKTEKKEVPTDTEKKQYKLSDDYIFHLDCKKAFVKPKGKNDVLSFQLFKNKLTSLLETHAQQTELTNYWLPLAEWVKELAKQQNTMPYSAFVAGCKTELQDSKYGGLYQDEVLDEQAIKNLFTYLHNMTSTVLYYPDIPELKDTVFINPNWLNDNIYRILSRDVVEQQKGEFTLQHVKESIIGDNPKEMIALMKQFELIFAKPNTADTYIAPQYLPEKCESDLQALDYDHLVFTIRFKDFLPRSVFLRFIAQYGEQALNYWYWKTGIIFKQNKFFIFAQHQTTAQHQNISLHANALLSNENKKQLFDTLKKIIDHDNFEIAVEADTFKPYRRLSEQYREERYCPTGFEFLFNQSSRPNIKQTMNHKEHLQQLVAQGKLKQAIEELLAATQQNGQSDLHNNTIQLSGRFHRNEKDRNDGVVTVDEYTLELNKIRRALSSYLNEYQPVFTPQGDKNGTENPPPPPKATCQTVLFMCASPSDVANVLNFGAEFEKIKQALNTSPNRDKFDIKIETSVKYDNIQRLLLQHQPSVLHISMHNSLRDGFLFEKADGIRIALSDQQLSSMIQVGTEGHLPNLIVLSACNSKTHADAVKPYTTHLIAMNDFISDEAAAYYASEFYKLYFDTQNIKTAHNGAINNLRANNSLTDNQKSALIPYIAK